MLAGQAEAFRLADIKCRHAARDFLHQGAARGAENEFLLLLTALAQLWHEFKADDAAHLVAFDHHLTLAGHGAQQVFLGIVEAADQMRGAAVHEARRQALMQRVAHRILGGASGFLLGGSIAHPIGTGGDIGPDPDCREAGHQRVQIALDAGAGGDLRGDPVRRHGAVLTQMREEPRAKPGMGVIGQLAEIRHLAGFPQQLQPRSGRCHAADRFLTRQKAKRDVIHRVMPLGEAGLRGCRAQAVQQGLDAREIEIAVAPGQRLDRLEVMALDLLDHLLRQGRAFARHAEGAIAHAPARAAGDLRGLLRGQLAGRMAVELVQAGEGHMVHIHVQPHADGVGRHQEIHLAVLVHLHLGIAGARAEATHHHGASATAAADGLGDGIDFGGRESDHGAAGRQARQLGGAGIFQLGQAGPRLDLDLRHQALQQGADGFSAHEHRLDQAARMQQPVGEDMAAIRVGAELDFIHRQEFDAAIQRHGFHRAGEPLGVGRDDLFLAGDEGDILLALGGHHAVVILARQEAEREADDAGGMRKHALHRQMGLAGVGGAEKGLNARVEHAGFQ